MSKKQGKGACDSKNLIPPSPQVDIHGDKKVCLDFVGVPPLDSTWIDTASIGHSGSFVETAILNDILFLYITGFPLVHIHPQQACQQFLESFCRCLTRTFPVLYCKNGHEYTHTHTQTPFIYALLASCPPPPSSHITSQLGSVICFGPQDMSKITQTWPEKALALWGLLLCSSSTWKRERF